MKESEIIRKALREVNRDIEGMLQNGATTEYKKKILSDAREYRKMLEEDLERAMRKEAKAGEPVIIGIIINLN